MNSGSQPPPGIFVSLPFGQWHVKEIRDASGDQFLSSQFQGFDLRVILPALVVVTRYQVFGARYGFIVATPFTKIQPERVTDVAQGNWGLGDVFVSPVYLGWHMAQADIVAGYGFFAPTGKYEAGASDNVGLGMWSHELQAGGTAFLDEGRKFSLATTAYLEMHSMKKNQELRVGNLLTLEGGAAYNVPKIGGAFGVGYYLQEKLSEDTGGDVPIVLLRTLNLYGKNHLFGIGPDVTMGLFQNGRTVGSMTIRYLWDTSARSSFKGNTLWVAFTIGELSK